MVIKLTCSKTNPPIGGLIIAEIINNTNPVTLEWNNSNNIVTFENDNKLNCYSGNDVLRALSNAASAYHLNGDTVIDQTSIDHWLTLSLVFNSNLEKYLPYLNKCLAPITYLVSNKLTIADLAIFEAIYSNYANIEKKGLPVHVQRWYNFINETPNVTKVLKCLPKDIEFGNDFVKKIEITTEKQSTDRKQEGKFIELPGAEMGKVVVRFPPEASGYLHIGHAKAALLNQYYQEAFKGKLIMRFDDTNPAKEKVDFEKVILEDLKMLEIKPDLFTHTSQYFDLMLEYCEQLLKEGKAYVDDTEPEQMKKEREQRIESPNRQNSADKNFSMWKEMLIGSESGQKCCVRAKIDMSSPNGCLRDPTIYRCKNEPHPRTGTQYKVYPTYDFACPIVDAIENVTHTLRTMEYHDRDDQFYWFIEALGLRRPYIWEYSRLNMTNTVLSKRKLTWFVDNARVDGWDDARMPTVRGILRRGMTVEGLRQFIIAQGSSKSVVFMEWDKIWAFNKKVIDPIAPRYTALEEKNTVTVNVAGATKGKLTVPAHPKNTEVGTKIVDIGPKILIDYVDAEQLIEGENATFINWGNIRIKKVHKSNEKITSVDAQLNLEDKDFKKTLKLTWLCELHLSEYPPTYCVYFDHIISKPILGKEEDFKQYIDHPTRTEVCMLGDPELKKVKHNDIIQLQRRGFFRVECAYKQLSIKTGIIEPVVLYSIPDGHTKETYTATQPKKTTASETKSSISTTKADSKKEVEKQASNPESNAVTVILDNIIVVGNKIRDLKAKKATKADIEAEVKILLGLKAEYKAATGNEWTPNTVAPKSESKLKNPVIEDKQSSNEGIILEKITVQGNKIRDLKSKKAGKAEIEAEVKILLGLKTEYKSLTGKEWKPDTAAPVTQAKVDIPVTGVKQSSNEVEILEKISIQGNKIRDLKSQKAGKAELDIEVKTLLGFKADYKQITGKDWKPEVAATVPVAVAPVILSAGTAQISSASQEVKILDKIAVQGNKIRDLKLKKAGKVELDAEVKTLLGLKAEYKSITGKEWKPDSTAVVSQGKAKSKEPVKASVTEIKEISKETEILENITVQGNKIRDLKSKKAEKAAIDTEVKVLLQLKADYKALTGNEWKPDTKAPVKTKAAPKMDNEPKLDKEILTDKINEQGNVVRSLKSNGGAKADVDSAVKLLLDLKIQYKTLTGTDFPTAGRQQAVSKQPKKEEKKVVPEPKEDGSAVKKQTRLGLEATKESNLPEWYSQVITKGEMIEYYDVSGCYILRHWSYAVWKVIKYWFDEEITKMGVKECYFPLFVSRAALEKEKTHIADFAPEVAWVTKSGESDLAEPIAVRPTSETVMYPAYAKWIQSYRDLPIRLNQWNNVVRWEFKHPQPFLRTREFLWQEGHTAFAGAKEAQEEVLEILDLYAKVYTDLLAIPVVKGRKTEKEKFAGGDYTTTVEAYISASGRAIQGATSHHLGQNFSKMFDIIYEDPETQTKQYVYQNSWGITTRTIGVMVMVHADNQGLVLPPNVACIQVIIVPCGITVNMSEADRQTLLNSCKELEKSLVNVKVKAEGDYRDNYSPGWKFNHWELKGVPIRIELGPKDLKANQFVAVRRDTGEKITIKRDVATSNIPDLLKKIHTSMYNKADKDMKDHTKITKEWSEFCTFLDAKNIIMSPFCGDTECEEKIKADSARDDAENLEPGAPAMGAKSLCIPFTQPAEISPSDKCVHPACKNKPKFYTLFGRSY